MAHSGSDRGRFLLFCLPTPWLTGYNSARREGLLSEVGNMQDARIRRVSLGRRGALRLLGLSAAAAALVGCGEAIAPPSTSGGPAAGAPAPADKTGGAPPPPPKAVQAADATQFSPVTVIGVWTGTGEAGDKFANPNGIAVDANDNVYIADTGGKRVVKFGKDGKFIEVWKASEGDGAFESPVAITASPNGHIYVLDKATGFVQWFSPDGKFVGKLGGPGSGFYNPQGLGASKDAVYVADTGAGRAAKYSATGEKLLDLAKRGTGEGAANEPTDVEIDSDGTILILDGSTSQLLRYTEDGKYQGVVEVSSTGSGHLVRLPDGTYLVTDPYKDRLGRWDKAGTIVATYGGSGDQEGKFKLPTGVGVDSAGNVYVVDAQNNRVQKLSLS